MAKKKEFEWDESDFRTGTGGGEWETGLLGTGTGYGSYVPPKRPNLTKPQYHAPEAFKPVAPDRGPYQSPWQADIDKILSDIKNRKPFDFDINGDAVFQALKGQAIAGGKRAMADTMAKAAATTGGMNNSYSQAVAQQAYQGYLQDLNAHIPAIAQAAEARYDRQGADMKDRLALYMGMDRDAYGKHRDQAADDRYANDQAYQQWRDKADEAWRKYQQEYGSYRDQIADDRYAEQLEHDRWAENQEYIRRENEKTEAEKRRADAERKEYRDQIYDMIVNHGYMPSQQELDRAGMYQGEADSLLNSWQQVQSDREAARYSKYSGGGGGGSGKRDYGGYDRMYDMITENGYRPSSEELANVGMSQGEADALYDTWYRNTYGEDNPDSIPDYGDSGIFGDDSGLYFGPDANLVHGPGGLPLPAEDYKQPDVFSITVEANELLQSGASGADVYALLDDAMADGYINYNQRSQIIQKLGI